MIKLTLQATTTLLGVLGLYLAPWLLGLGAQPVVEAMPQIQAPREAVVWMPPPPPPEQPPPLDEPAETAPSAAPIEETPIETTPETVAPVSEVPQVATVDTPPRKKPARGPKRGVTRRTGPVQTKPVATRTRSAKKPLTRKQQRRRDRWERKQERLAQQPQCRDHLDGLLQIDGEGRKTRWMASRELVQCYRQHPGQFMNIGAMDWSKDDRGRKQGLAIYVSSRERGEVARAIGLKRGDVLTSLNGVSLRNPATASLALTQLTRDRARLVFERDGKRHVLEVSVVDGDAIAALQRARQAFAPKPRIARARHAHDR